MARAMPLRRTHLTQMLGSLIAAAVMASGMWTAVAWAVSRLIPDPAAARLAAQLQVLFGMGVAYFILSLTFHYLVLAVEETRRAERTADEAQILTREAKLTALRAQINPHFLFNSLNSIAALTLTDGEQARHMCQLLSTFLRSSLAMGDRATVTMKEELALIRNYLEIEQVRFQDRMAVEEHIDDKALSTPVPALLLQPLVENAVKHGIGNLETGGVIKLAITGRPDGVTVTLENPIDPGAAPKPGTSKGLSIVRDRLQTFYGDEAKMVVQKDPDRYRVRIRIPNGATADADA
jgi:LytS/YehU family sensor histidine kinase